MRLSTASLTAALLVTASGCAMRMTPAFDPLGKKVDRYSAPKAVATIDEVRVFAETAPSGFQRKGDQVVVEPGHQHRVVGRLLLERNGSCQPSDRARTDVMDLLRREAYMYGGNAVVYATTPIRENATSTELCRQLGTETTVGSGWVVVLGERAPVKQVAPAKKAAPARKARPAAAPEAPAAAPEAPAAAPGAPATP
jgi:hypothetical protein